MGASSGFKESSVAHLLLAINFFISGLIINCIQAFLWITLRPLSKRWYRIVNQYICYSLNCQLVFLAEWWANSETWLYIDQNELEKYYNKEHGFLVMNHKYEIDWLMGFLLCERVGVLGNCKVYAKKSVQYVPVIGWLWKFAESVFLERNLERDKDIIARQISELADHPTPIFLLLFAEGTRFTNEKHEASIKFAKERNLPILKHHLTPRTKGFTMSLIPMRGKIPAVYDVTLCVKDSWPVAPTITNLLKGRRVEAHMYMQRIPMEEIPEDEEGAAQWLRDLYVKKDKMVDSFKETGDFFATSGVKKLEKFLLPRRWWSLINTVGWSFITLPSISYLLVSLIFSGSLVNFFIGVLILLAISFVFYVVVGFTKISKSSSYGKSQQSIDRKSHSMKTE